MKQIFINGRYLTQRTTGVQRLAAEVVSSLDKLLDAGVLTGEYEVTLLAPARSFAAPELKRVKLVRGGIFSGHLWEQLDLPRLARGGVLFNPCGPSPLFHPFQVTVLPDASIFLAPQGYSFVYLIWTRFLYRAAGLRARRILTISNYSRKMLLRHCRTLRRAKIAVVYLGSEHILRCGVDESVLANIFERGAGKDYILCVGSQQANKNVKIVASISAWLDARGISTVVTGGSQKAVFRGEQVAGKGMIATGYVTDSQLRALYMNARCFVFPSFEEGFGLPPLEAMRCMCPVVASTSASMPEVCGDGAIYFDPYDAESLKTALDSVLLDAAEAERLKGCGASQAEKYTWERTACEVWAHLLAEAGHVSSLDAINR